MNSTTNIKKSHCNIIGRDNVTITLTLKNNNNNNKENTVNVTVTISCVLFLRYLISNF